MSVEIQSSSSSAQTLLGKILQSRYRLDAFVGKGGMAWVYRARDMREQKVVAVKVLLPHLTEEPRLRARFEGEGRFQARLHHPNIVQVLDVVVEEPICAIVMEWIEGEELRHLLKRLQENIPVMEVWHLVAPLLEALGEAHRCSLIHRDIKPSNILLHEEDGLMIPKIADFGIAKALDEVENELTRTGASLGTIKYMAPEQFLDSKTVDQRADIYSFGVLLFLLLTGRMPFRGDSQVALYQQMNEGAPSLRSIQPDISPALEEVVLTCLAPQREARYPSCDALLRALALVMLEGVGERLEECRAWDTAAMRERLLQHFTQRGENASQSTLQGFAAGTVLHEAFLQRPKVPVTEAELGTSSSQGYNSHPAPSRKIVPLGISASSPLPSGNPTSPLYTEQKNKKEQGGILNLPSFEEPAEKPNIWDSSSRIASSQMSSSPSFSLHTGGALSEGQRAASRKAPSSAQRASKQKPKESSSSFFIIFGGLTALVLLGGGFLFYPLLKSPAPPPPEIIEPPLRVVEQGEGYWDEQLRPVWKPIGSSEGMSMVWEKQRVWVKGKRPLPPPPLPEKNKTKKSRRIQPRPRPRIRTQIAKPPETKKTKKR